MYILVDTALCEVQGAVYILVTLSVHAHLLIRDYKRLCGNGLAMQDYLVD